MLLILAVVQFDIRLKAPAALEQQAPTSLYYSPHFFPASFYYLLSFLHFFAFIFRAL